MILRSLVIEIEIELMYISEMVHKMEGEPHKTLTNFVDHRKLLKSMLNHLGLLFFFFELLHILTIKNLINKLYSVDMIIGVKFSKVVTHPITLPDKLK